MTEKSPDLVLFWPLLVQWFISRKAVIFQGSREVVCVCWGGPTFSRGGVGSNCYVLGKPIEFVICSLCRLILP